MSSHTYSSVAEKKSHHWSKSSLFSRCCPPVYLCCTVVRTFFYLLTFLFYSPFIKKYQQGNLFILVQLPVCATDLTPSLLKSSIYNDISSHLQLPTASIPFFLPNPKTLEEVYHVTASQTVISCLYAQSLQCSNRLSWQLLTSLTGSHSSQDAP